MTSGRLEPARVLDKGVELTIVEPGPATLTRSLKYCVEATWSWCSSTPPTGTAMIADVDEGFPAFKDTFAEKRSTLLQPA